MKKGFRQSMAWLHTWTGLAVGWLLYFVFVTGTIGYFYVEIDRWMRPELPLRGPAASVSRMVAAADEYLRAHAAGAAEWTIALPSGRDPALAIAWVDAAPDARGGGASHRRIFDVAIGTFREPHVRDTGGGYLLYRMHYSLHYLPVETAYRIVGLCAMVMLVALITGVVTHKKIVADFFTFRPGTGQRAWLDAHTLVSVAALPFFVMITYSGLLLLMWLYVPAAAQVLYGGDLRRLAIDSGDLYERPATVSRAGGSVLPLTRLLADAARYRGPDTAWSWLQVIAPGAAEGELRLFDAGRGTVLRAGDDELHVSAVDGHLIRQVRPDRSWPRETESALYGLHEGSFAGPALRWLYFVSGLLGCAMVATGLVLWTVKRRARSGGTRAAGRGQALVERLNVGTIAGLPVGVAAYFWANRLLPAAFADRAAWEVHAMFLAWAAMLAYGAMRPLGRAWVEELTMAAAAFALLPGVNALTTDRHLGVTIPAGDWALAGVDLTALALGLVFGTVARGLHRRLRNAGADGDANAGAAALHRPARVSSGAAREIG